MESIISIPAVAGAVYALMEILKSITNNNETVKRFIPLIALGLGAGIGVLLYYFMPDIMTVENVVAAIIVGAASGLSATGVNQIGKQLNDF